LSCLKLRPLGRYRSRFTRAALGVNDDDSDSETVGGGSRSRAPSRPASPQAPRERVLDTEDVTKGPLSGILRLYDSPRINKRLQDSECKEKKKEKDKCKPAPPSPSANKQVSPPTAAVSQSQVCAAVLFSKCAVIIHILNWRRFSVIFTQKLYKIYNKLYSYIYSCLLYKLYIKA
jgi:hypothetical protein